MSQAFPSHRLDLKAHEVSPAHAPCGPITVKR